MTWRDYLTAFSLASFAWWMYQRFDDAAGEFDAAGDVLDGGFSGMIPEHRLQAFIAAIGRAEGANVPGSVPDRANNPGDMKVGDVGLGTINGITIFATDADGERALERQLDLIVTGRSHVYSADMTIAEMAEKWTTTESSAWAANVAAALGVSVNTRLADLLT